MLYIFHVQKRKLYPRLETQTRQIFVVSGSLMLARIKAPRELNFNLFPRHIIKKKSCIFFCSFCTSVCLGRPYKVVVSNICEPLLTKTGLPVCPRLTLY